MDSGGLAYGASWSLDDHDHVALAPALAVGTGGREARRTAADDEEGRSGHPPFCPAAARADTSTTPLW